MSAQGQPRSADDVITPVFEKETHSIATLSSNPRDPAKGEGNDMYFGTGKHAKDDAIPDLGILEAKSRPASPPSRDPTPIEMRRRHSYCPDRLTPYTPPPNYGTVIENKVFRSGFPSEKNLSFLQSLHIKSILCLVSTEPCEAYAAYTSSTNIVCYKVDVAANKEGKGGTSVRSIYEALMVVLDKRNYPLQIHCNQGRHRTGCLVACLRKTQGWDVEDAIAEYHAYASPKSRLGDVAFIRSFDCAGLVAYARDNGFFEQDPLSSIEPSLINSVDILVDCLGSVGVPVLDSSSSDRSSSSAYSNTSSELMANSPTPYLNLNASSNVRVASKDITTTPGVPLQLTSSSDWQNRESARNETEAVDQDLVDSEMEDLINWNGGTNFHERLKSSTHAHTNTQT